MSILNDMLMNSLQVISERFQPACAGACAGACDGIGISYYSCGGSCEGGCGWSRCQGDCDGTAKGWN